MSDYTAARQQVEGYSALLARLTLANNANRNDAEATFNQFELNNPSHALTLTLISTAQEGKEIPVPVRQLAAVLLGKYVKEQGDWSSTDEQQNISDKSKFGISAEAKQELVRLLLTSLSGCDTKIRDLNAHVVAAIVKQEWRTMWEPVLTVLMTMMNTRDNDEVLSSLKVVAAVLDGTLYDKEFLRCSSSLPLTIGQLIHSPQTTDNCRVHAIKCLAPYIRLVTRGGCSTSDSNVSRNFK